MSLIINKFYLLLQIESMEPITNKKKKDVQSFVHMSIGPIGPLIRPARGVWAIRPGASFFCCGGGLPNFFLLVFLLASLPSPRGTYVAKACV